MRFQLIRTYQGHQDTICALAPIPGQARFVSASHDGLIKTWNLRSDSSLVLRQGTDSYPTAIDIFPAGFFMAAGLSDGSLEIWNLESGEVVRSLEGHQGPVTAIAITHSGQRLISGSQDRTVRIWNSLTGSLLHIGMGHQTAIKTLAVTPDDKTVMAGESGDGETPGLSKAWGIETGIAASEFNDMPNGRQYMAVLRDGRQVMSGSDEGEMIVWDRETGENLHHVNVHPGPTVMALMPDQKSVIVGTPAPSLALWDLTTGEKLYQFDEPSAEVVSIAIMTHGRYVIAGCQNGSLNLYMRVS
jgi:WD40 repeat protein